MERHNTWPVIALMVVAAIWGSTFVVMADAIARYPMLAFLSIRFIIATLALLLVSPGIIKKLNRANLTLGLAASVFLTAAYILQTASLLPASLGGTTPARSAFLTGMYVVFVPVFLSIFHRKWPSRAVGIGMALAVGGLWALSGLTLTRGLTHWVRGDSLVLLSALGYACHMLVLGRAGGQHDAKTLSFIQMTVLALVTGIASLAVGEHAGMPAGWQVWSALILTGLFASTFAYTVQTWAQLKLPPARVALVLVLEPAFGGLLGWLVAGWVVPREALGAVMLLGAMICSELIPSKESI